MAITAAGGTFTLTYSGQETDPLSFDVACDDLRDALERLARVGQGNVVVSGRAGGPFELRFGGALTGRDIAVVEADDTALEGTAIVTTEVPSPWE
ncbi:MAG: hypothetical protein ACR2LK_16510 [Solirubrobacteraceae bacterium]